MDYLALAATNYFLKRGKGNARIFFASLAASFCGLLAVSAVADARARTLFVCVLVTPAMVFFCFGKSRVKAFLEETAATYLVTLFLGGVMQLEQNLLDTDGIFWAQAALAAVLLAQTTRYLNGRKQFGENLYPVAIFHRGKKIGLCGYWDSGNQLTDPYNGRAVSILGKEAAERLIDEKRDLPRLIPYRSLGENGGLIAVVRLECMQIYDGKNVVEIKPFEAGIANAGLFEGKEYELILHASLLVNQERGKKHDNKARNAKI